MQKLKITLIVLIFLYTMLAPFLYQKSYADELNNPPLPIDVEDEDNGLEQPPLYPIQGSQNKNEKGILIQKRPHKEESNFYSFLPALDISKLPEDVLFNYEAVNFIDSSLLMGGFKKEGTSTTMQLDASIGAGYERAIEKKDYGFSLKSNGFVSLLNQKQMDLSGEVSIGLNGTIQEGGDARYYLNDIDKEFFLGAKDSFNLMFSTGIYKSFGTSINILFGAGWGRVIDYSESIRLKKIDNFLKKEGVIKRHIPENTGSRILKDFYLLRNRIGTQDNLFYLLKELYDDNLIFFEPKPSQTYPIIQVLSDPLIKDRLDGIILFVGPLMDLQIKTEKNSRGGTGLWAGYYRNLDTDSWFGATVDLKSYFINPYKSVDIYIAMAGEYRRFLYDKYLNNTGVLKSSFYAGYGNFSWEDILFDRYTYTLAGADQDYFYTLINGGYTFRINDSSYYTVGAYLGYAKADKRGNNDSLIFLVYGRAELGVSSGSYTDYK